MTQTEILEKLKKNPFDLYSNDYSQGFYHVSINNGCITLQGQIQYAKEILDYELSKALVWDGQFLKGSLLFLNGITVDIVFT